MLLVLMASIAVPSIATAKARYALVVGVGGYRDASGLNRLAAPPSDAESMKAALSATGVDFVVDMLQDKEAGDKTVFEAALAKFLARVQADDEVLFYFSGHGFHVPDRGNFFLLPDAKAQQAYIQGLGASASREFDTQDKKDKAYQKWITDTAISEELLEKSISARKPSVIILIADACRNLIGKTKGAALVTSGISLPGELPSGTFRLYSASPGQISFDGEERADKKANRSDEGRDDKDEAKEKSTDKKTSRAEPSLFTRVLFQQLQIPKLEINDMFARLKIDVREQARNRGGLQVPAFSDSPDASRFYFRQNGTFGGELQALCVSAPRELAQLRYGVAAGSISRDVLEKKRVDLAPCGEEYSSEIDKLLRLESQGAGALSTSTNNQLADISKIDDPLKICDVFATSPFDPNRPPDSSSVDVQKIALESLDNAQNRKTFVGQLQRIIDACEKAVKSRDRVARYKFNLARSYYAQATLAEAKLDRVAALVQASAYYQEAVDLGYVAAYNDLAVMLQNGEFYTVSEGALPRALPRDYKKAGAYLQRGADLGHVVALYNLGIAYKNGDYGFDASVSSASADKGQMTSAIRENRAYRYLSQAAEMGYVPAMVETALLLHYWPNTPYNPKRVVELLEAAAARGSWEAMYQLGVVYRDGSPFLRVGDYYVTGLDPDPNEAVVWFARSAEAGDIRAQTRVAGMLLDGDGLPAAQPDAAGRYLRLAAETGDNDAQMRLADRMRDGKISFRPRADGKYDGGGAEIYGLYMSAFLRGKTEAGLHLARLFRGGFPADRPSDAIPRSADAAARLLWATIEKVRTADPASDDANPELEILASVELIKMYDAGEAKGVGGPDFISQDQINQLRSDYGDISRLTYVLTQAVDTVNCRGRNYWVMIWDGKTNTLPTDAQFDWFERRFKCKELSAREREEAERDAQKDSEKSKQGKIKEADLGVPKKTRDIFKHEFDAARQEQKEKEKSNSSDKTKVKSFVDRIVSLVSKKKSN